MRKLATIRKIDEIRPIEKADAIEVAVVGGWSVVVKRGEFTPGDLAVYLEIDSWVPTELAPFLSKGKEPREFQGIKGERLKTIKLRGQLSQGLLLPLKDLYGKLLGLNDHYDGQDVTENLGIQKWEAPINPQLAGQVRGNFPSLIPKTDQERAQNLVKEIRAAAEAQIMFEVTEKLEGSSMTAYLIDGVFGVCSRNIDLKEVEGNTFWDIARRDGIEARMRAYGLDNIALQGELIGPGIQGNIYGIGAHEFRVFDVFDVKRGDYLLPKERIALVFDLGLQHVPVLAVSAPVDSSVDALLAQADGTSVVGSTKCLREGIVFKQVDGGMTFKAISNQYLLGEK